MRRLLLPVTLVVAFAAATPAVSPDGTRIAFARNQDIWVMNADGSGQAPLTGTEGSGETSPAWSPDGRRLAFVSNRSLPNGGTTGPELWVMDADGGNVRRLTDTQTGGSFAPVRVRGTGGAPHVVLDGPGGARVDAGAPLVSDRVVVLRDETSTYIGLRRGGTWRLSAAPGSPPIAGVDSAAVLERPLVSARVSGKGTRRMLTWNLRALPGQRVTFSEQGGAVLATTRKARGRVRFTPGPGVSRTRRIVATVEQHGLPRDTLRVARYTAPAPARPGRPRGVKAVRRGSGLAVSWRPVKGAALYEVHVTAGGRRELFRVRGRSVRIPDAPARAVITVRAQRADGAPGPSVRLRVR